MKRLTLLSVAIIAITLWVFIPWLPIGLGVITLAVVLFNEGKQRLVSNDCDDDRDLFI